MSTTSEQLTAAIAAAAHTRGELKGNADANRECAKLARAFASRLRQSSVPIVPKADVVEWLDGLADSYERVAEAAERHMRDAEGQ